MPSSTPVKVGSSGRCWQKSHLATAGPILIRPMRSNKSVPPGRCLRTKAATCSVRLLYLTLVTGIRKTAVSRSSGVGMMSTLVQNLCSESLLYSEPLSPSHDSWYRRKPILPYFASSCHEAGLSWHLIRRKADRICPVGAALSTRSTCTCIICRSG